jgi:hypothetical protein
MFYLEPDSNRGQALLVSITCDFLFLTFLLLVELKKNLNVDTAGFSFILLIIESSTALLFSSSSNNNSSLATSPTAAAGCLGIGLLGCKK